jgi:ubiquinone/menaquinone biosynthesis C-methylase UbiE
MEEYKQHEKEHYDAAAREWLGAHSKSLKDGTDVSGIEVAMMESYRDVYRILAAKVNGKEVLDYGSGHGMHAVPIAKWGGQVTGVDFSEESLKIARERAAKEEANINFVVGDCEALPFTGANFDIIFDGGTFSSLTLEKAFSEIARVLRPDGLLIGIETLGHNPLANLKRWLNRKRGVRTGWAADHIFKMEDLELAKKYFTIEQTHYFHLFSMFTFPLRNLPGGKLLFRTLDKIDDGIFMMLPFLKRYAFKIVFVFKKK